MKQYSCPECGRPVFAGEGMNSGQIKMLCPNRSCPSRRVTPVRKQTFTFGGAKR